MTEKAPHPQRARVVAALTVVSLLLAYVLGDWMYTSLVRGAYEDLESAIDAATPLRDAIRQDPAVSPVESGGEDVRESQLLTLLHGLALVTPSTGPEDVPDAFWHAHGVGNGGGLVPFDVGGPELMLRVAQAFGSDASGGAGGSSPEEIRERLTPLLVTALAGTPGASNRFVECAEGSAARRDDSSAPQPDCEAIAPTDEELAATGDLTLLATRRTNRGVDPLITSAFHALNVPAKLLDIADLGERDGTRGLAVSYTRQLALLIESDPAVSIARYEVTVAEGPEQRLMLILCWVLFLLGVGRVLVAYAGVRERKPGADRWLLTYCLRALPTVGFVGTVRGLAEALANADTIVSATTAVQQASAIGSVSTTLALAFTTTLVALLLGLVFGLLDRVLHAMEKKAYETAGWLETRRQKPPAAEPEAASEA